MPISDKAKPDQDWINRALTSADGVWNLGQIDKPTERALNKLVKQGLLLKCRGHFMGISPPKTIWCHGKAVFKLIEGVRVVEAHGALAAEIALAAEQAGAA